MTKRHCKIQQKINELIKKSTEVKIELDKTPLEDEKRFISLLKSLLKFHQELDKIRQ